MPNATQKTDVLIVGAGPTGLMAAAQLTRFGIDHIIIDKKDAPSDKSRAIGIQARTLEIFDQMGIQKTFLEHGEQIGRVKIYSRNFNIANVHFGAFGKGLSPYPFVLILGQQVTEKALTSYAEKHGSTITWNTEAVSFNEKKDTVVTTVKTKQGKTKTIESSWVIGADGARSLTRKHMNVEFGGHTYETQFWLADAEISWKQPQHTLLVWFSKRSFLAFFPMGKHKYRLTGAFPDNRFSKESLTLKEVQENIDSLDITAKVTKVEWTSIFNLHRRNTKTFHTGRFFLAGDSSHIHSPAGAQGMNTGLQDAYNLAWKLAYVIKGYASEDILASYDQERVPFARQLTKSTDRLFQLVVSRNILKKLLRNVIIWTVSHTINLSKFGKHRFFKLISQTAIGYPKSMLSKDFTHHSKYSAGDRIKTSEKIFDHNRMTLLLSKTLLQDEESLKKLSTKYTDLIKVIEMPKAHGDTGFILVRPDMYIASIGETFEQYDEYMTHFFQPS